LRYVGNREVSLIPKQLFTTFKRIENEGRIQGEIKEIRSDREVEVGGDLRNNHLNCVRQYGDFAIVGMW
jgi:hypothetical protein